jgi:hypothetical protein
VIETETARNHIQELADVLGGRFQRLLEVSDLDVF